MKKIRLSYDTMRKADILIIGGGPAGVVSAITARRNNSKKKIILVRKEKKIVIPCGIPYIFHRLDSLEKNLISDKLLSKNKIKLIVNEAVKIDPSNKIVFLKDKTKLIYEKLVLATGSESFLIPVKGVDKKGVWYIKKDYEYLEKVRKAVLKSKNIVIVGGGFVGVELAEELSNIKDLNISIVEKMKHCLGTTFDDKFAIAGEKKLKEMGVKIYTNIAVEEIVGRKKVEYVKLSNRKKIPADLVIFSIGMRPNVELAKKTGIKLEENGIWVDEYLRTNVPDVFAVGDCVQRKDFFTQKNIPVMLASTSCSEARMVGANLYQLKILRENKGTLGTFSTYINGLVLGVAGLTEKAAKSEGFNIVAGSVKTSDQHPEALPGTKTVYVKLIFSKSSEGLLLGGQVMGAKGVNEMVNIIATAIQQNMSAFDFDTSQISTHPLLTTAPTVYPLITAAQLAIKKMR